MSYTFRASMLDNQIVQTILSTLPSLQACLFIVTVLFMLAWNLALTNNLTTLAGTAFIAGAVLALVLVLVVSVIVCGVWVVRMVARGEEAERADILKSEQERMFTGRN